MNSDNVQSVRPDRHKFRRRLHNSQGKWLKPFLAICVIVNVCLFGFMIYSMVGYWGLSEFGTQDLVNISVCMLTFVYVSVIYATICFDSETITSEKKLMILFMLTTCVSLFLDALTYLFSVRLFSNLSYAIVIIYIYETYLLIMCVLGINSPKYARLKKIYFVLTVLTCLYVLADNFKHFLFYYDENWYEVFTGYFYVIYIPMFIISVTNIVTVLDAKAKFEEKVVAVILSMSPPAGFLFNILEEYLCLSYIFDFMSVLFAFAAVYSGRERELKKKQTDLDFAASVQKGVLPRTQPLIPGCAADVCGMTNTSNTVGGDFYDYYMTDDRHLCMTIGDVCGNNISSALMMMQTVSSIRDCAMSGLSCDEIFGRVNRNLYAYNADNYFAMAWFGMLDIETGELEYVSAGHRQPALKRVGSAPVSLNDKTNMPIAIFPDSEYEKRSVTLLPGDIVLLYTSGAAATAADLSSASGAGEYSGSVDPANTSAPAGTDYILSRFHDIPDDLNQFCSELLSSIAKGASDMDMAENATVLSLRYNGFKEADL